MLSIQHPPPRPRTGKELYTAPTPLEGVPGSVWPTILQPRPTCLAFWNPTQTPRPLGRSVPCLSLGAAPHSTGSTLTCLEAPVTKECLPCRSESDSSRSLCSARSPVWVPVYRPAPPPAWQQLACLPRGHQAALAQLPAWLAPLPPSRLCSDVVFGPLHLKWKCLPPHPSLPALFFSTELITIQHLVYGAYLVNFASSIRM